MAIYLGNQNLATFPNIGENTRTLDLSHNQITSLPDSIGNLTNLNFLDLSHNQITSLPDSIGNLANLQVLHLENNQITSLPDSIGNLANLDFLNLEDNQITSLPDSIGNLANLRTLQLKNNQISLPDSIGNLTNLRVLNLEDNQITTLPDFIGNLTNLIVLDLSHNQITTLPDFIGNLTLLETLYLKNNPITDVSVAIDLPALYNLSMTTHNKFILQPLEMTYHFTNIHVLEIVRNSFDLDRYNIEFKEKIINQTKEQNWEDRSGLGIVKTAHENYHRATRKVRDKPVTNSVGSKVLLNRRLMLPIVASLGVRNKYVDRTLNEVLPLRPTGGKRFRSKRKLKKTKRSRKHKRYF